MAAANIVPVRPTCRPCFRPCSRPSFIFLRSTGGGRSARARQRHGSCRTFVVVVVVVTTEVPTACSLQFAVGTLVSLTVPLFVFSRTFGIRMYRYVRTCAGFWYQRRSPRGGSGCDDPLQEGRPCAICTGELYSAPALHDVYSSSGAVARMGVDSCPLTFLWVWLVCLANGMRGLDGRAGAARLRHGSSKTGEVQNSPRAPHFLH